MIVKGHLLLKMSGRPTRKRVQPARLREYETDGIAVQEQAGLSGEAAAVQAGQEVQPGGGGGGGGGGAGGEIGEVLPVPPPNEHPAPIAEEVLEELEEEDEPDREIEVEQLPAGSQRERGDLTDRLLPVVPPPLDRPQSEDGDGWDLIDRVGGWNAILCQFPIMEEVPHQYRVIWGWACGEVFRQNPNTS